MNKENKLNNASFSEKKLRVLNSITHRPVDRVPMMYRALNGVHRKMLEYFELGADVSRSWMDLMEIMGFDLFSSGNGIGKFTKIKPEYKGLRKVFELDGNMFYAFGIESYFDEISGSINYRINRKFAGFDNISEMERYKFPDPEEFKFINTGMDLNLRREHFFGTGTLNSIFMISQYMRGTEKLMMELLIDQKIAKYYIDRIGDFCLNLLVRTLKEKGKILEFFALWDDLAMQTGLLIPYEMFKKFYFPWYKKMFALAKNYGLITYFHVCGNANEIIPDLINIGTDILDPVQTSAKDMSLDKLKKSFGKNICFHGGIDVQKMLVFASPEEIINYVRWVTGSLYKGEGGIILGPSHDITVDTPVENILAVYRPDMLGC